MELNYNFIGTIISKVVSVDAPSLCMTTNDNSI